MFCNKCGNQVADQAKFCNHCGNPLASGETMDAVPATVVPTAEESVLILESVDQADAPSVPVEPPTVHVEITETGNVEPAPQPIPQPVPPVQQAQPVTPPHPAPQPQAVSAPQQPIAQQQASRPAPAPVHHQPQQPQYQYQQAYPSRDEPLSVGSYLLMFILTAIPLVGLIMTIVWAVGAKNRNRKNFAIAALIMILIGIAVAIAGYFVLVAFLANLGYELYFAF